MDKKEIIQLRKVLHTLAEPSMQEYQTKALLMRWLKEHTDLHVVDCGKWFYAEYKKETEKKAIAFRGDFDAVLCQDGQARHLCGHDGHSSVLAAFAKELSDLSPDRSVYLIFQPGEETGEGGEICSSLIEEKGIQEIYAFHNIPGKKESEVLLLKNTFACASTGMELIFTGCPSHAAYPEQGKNPAMIITEMIRYADQLVKEPHKGIVLATVIGVDLGSSSYGVSAEKGSLKFTLRGELQEEYDLLVRRIREKALMLAKEAEMDCQIRLIEEFPATENTPACVKKVQDAAEGLKLAFSYPEEPFRWSEDFGYYLQKTKGAMFGVGCGEKHPGLHTEQYEFNDEILGTVVELYKELVRGE